jgi:hypothetical protein
VNAEHFDELSRAVAVGGPQRALRSYVSAATGTLAGWLLSGASAQAQFRVSHSCSIDSVLRCMESALAAVRAQAATCAAQCAAIADPILGAKECRKCFDTSVRDGESEMKACHARACGPGALCHTPDSGFWPWPFSSFMQGAGYCCPLGYLPFSQFSLPQSGAGRPPSGFEVYPSPGPLCRPQCEDQRTGQPLACSAMHKLDTTYCVCVCDPASVQCPSGSTLDVVSCQCV